MAALREQGIGIGESVLFGFQAEIDEAGEIAEFITGSCENLGSIGFHQGDVPSWLMPVDVEDILVDGPGTWAFQVWVEVGDREIRIRHNPDQAPMRVDTILAGMAEIFEDTRDAWTLELI